MKENDFAVKKSRQYTTETTTDADNADDLTLLKNLPDPAESLLHSQEHSARGIGLNENIDKPKFMCFKMVLSPY